MIGCYDFCGHYEWTFDWLEQEGGENLLLDYWREAVAADGQLHAAELITGKGIEGMREYWGHTLDHEAAGYAITSDDARFRVDMHECPSKGFLIRNGLEQHRDYCDHCMGWVGPVLGKAGFVIDHEHNHCGQCWWEMRKADDPAPPSEIGEFSGSNDVRHRSDWKQPVHDEFHRSKDATEGRVSGQG